MHRTLLPHDDQDSCSEAHSPAACLGPDEQFALDLVRTESASRRQTTGADVIYLPAAASCYAIVQYDPMSVRVIRRVVGLFSNVGEAEKYARGSRFYPYDVVPATAVIPQLP